MTKDLFDLLDFSTYRSVLCLNGDLPSRDLLNSLKLPIIAADGACHRLLGMGIVPKLTIGDLDSASSELLEKLPHIKNYDQNYSDFQKALAYIKNNDLFPAIICGLSGGYLDHILNNVNIFMEMGNSVFIENSQIGFGINDSLSLRLPFNTKISILAMPECTISTTGLKWELSQEKLAFPGKTSCFNRVSAHELNIQIHSGKALAILYRHSITDAGEN